MAGFLHDQKKRAPLVRVWDGVTIWSFLNAMDFGNHRLFRPDATGYPAVLRRCTDGGHPPVVTAQGSLGVLAGTLIGFFCSVRCPGDIILKTYDLARALRRADAGIIGGFQAAIEKEFLDILLRGTASVVICPARGLNRMRMPKSWRDPLTTERMLILSFFADHIRRPTAGIAARRNAYVATLADHILIAHAEPGSKTEELCKDALAAGKPVFALASADNAHLVELGAIPIPADNPETLLSRQPKRKNATCG